MGKQAEERSLEGRSLEEWSLEGRSLEGWSSEGLQLGSTTFPVCSVTSRMPTVSNAEIYFKSFLHTML